MRVTLMSGETVTVENPSVRNDSIVGATDGDVAELALGDIRLLEVRQLDSGFLAAVVVIAAAALIIYCVDEPCFRY